MRAGQAEPDRSGARPSLQRDDGFWIGRFSAMASPCELLVETDNPGLARRLVDSAWREARRIEHKFSRYRRDNIVHRINGSGGVTVETDAETANLLDYAARCFELSEGRFDVTSGVLREVWRFDQGSRVPDELAVSAVLQRVGWEKVRWQRPYLTLPAGMEIDLGGIGKEYAVDRAAQLLQQHTPDGLVVNFGGDLVVTGPRRDGAPWMVGVEDPRSDGRSVRTIPMVRGALATSGDARRYVVRDGVRYGHILDPKSGWPVRGGPRSVTVCAGTCMEAGMLATFAILQGAAAEGFLHQQQVPYWLA